MTIRQSCGTVLCVMSSFALAAYALSYLLSWFWIAELFTHFRIHLIAVLATLSGLLLICRYWRWATVMLGATALAAWPVVALLMPASQPPAGKTQLKLISANVLYANHDYEAFRRLVADEDPDLLLVVEYTAAWEEHLQDLREEYPYALLDPREQGCGIALFSKLPLNHAETRGLLDPGLPMAFADVQVDGQILNIIGVHLLSPLDPTRYSLRNEQLQELARTVSATPSPKIVVGDFNSTTWSPFLQEFLETTGLRDSRQGFGFQPSWPQQMALLRIPIDQLFVSSEIHVHRRVVGPDIGSDHFPIISLISITPK